MIALLVGTIARNTNNEVIVVCSGVGYLVYVSSTTAATVPEGAQDVTLHTTLVVREDAMTLYGFASQQEQQAFAQLTSIQGIGGKIALGILSVIELPTLAQAIATGNVVTLQKLPGIGKKTAERMIVELRDKMNIQSARASSGNYSSAMEDAVLALVALGYSRTTAEKSVRSIIDSDATMDSNAIIRKALALHQR
jgi:holliday junction DNA helicase RuvA